MAGAPDALMYTTCIFCHQPLGRNEAVEHFPVGRKLAFHAAKGRLWVVCARCAGWNLTPLEERWEAIEDCERLFRDARRRVSTDNIGLARLADGTELVRVGPAQRPEFAAWRYGERFVRRRRQLVGAAAATFGGVGAAVAAGAAGVFLWAVPVLVPAVIIGLTQVPPHDERRRARRFIHDVLARADRGNQPRMGDEAALSEILLRPAAGEEGWGLRIQSQLGFHVDFAGADALRTAAVILPSANIGGGTRGLVRRAVSRIEDAGDPARYFRHTLEWGRREGLLYTPITQYPPDVRLALEMAMHEEAERRAMEGELAILEQAWKDAEEIAAIADDLVLPSGVGAWLGGRK